MKLPGRNITALNSTITWQPNVKYLGLYLDKTMNFKAHIDYVIEKAQKAIKILYFILNRKSELDLRNKLLIYKVVIRPIFTYGCPAYREIANCHIKRLQILQNKTLKLILDKSRFERTDLIHEEFAVFLCDSWLFLCKQGIHT